MQNACPVCNYIRYLVLLTHLASLSVLIFFMRSISFLTTPTKFKGGNVSEICDENCCVWFSTLTPEFYQ